MSEVVRREEEALRFWQERDIFKKTLAKKSPRGEFVFYEGPPTANGLPGIHHLESRAFKDAVPRFRTMQGYHVRRKAGWDTHGIPVELEVEKKLGFKSKKDIESYGVAKFNEKCKESVLQYIDEWKKFTNRIAFWVDHDDTYFTFDNNYIESVWNVLKTAHARKLLYKDYKVVPWCPRCGTALSSHEVALGYDEAKDPSVYVKFKLKGVDEYLLAWTTTPWTLPGNVALAVGADVVYVQVRTREGTVWIAKNRLAAIAPTAEVLEETSGSKLALKEYEPLFPFLANSLPSTEKEKLQNAYKVYPADFVSTEDGTGIVHTAVMYGADDFELGTKVGLPKQHLVGEDGRFLPAAGTLAGKFVKDADKEIIVDLEQRRLLFKKGTVEHTYPFCWRCKSPLLYFARDSWYIAMSRIKNELIRENETIHWEPAHIREGRFGEWLRDIKDWAISRSRYWGTPLPIWECAKCKAFDVVGSLAELRQKAGRVPNDIHRPYVDELSFACACGGTMRRIPEVLDVWFDSGAMPFAQDHYPFDFAQGKPFENQELMYPADYICEAIDQTRGWFYTLHAVGGIMDRGKAFKNVISLGHVLDAKGKKMSKSLGNIVEPNAMIEKYGADALRFFMYTVNAPGDSKNFDERIVDEIVKKNLSRLGNVLAFYKLYADPAGNPSGSNGAGGTPRSDKSAHVLDRWILARLDELMRESTEGYETYKLDAAVRPIALFIDDLSTWYLRRSRDRIKAAPAASAVEGLVTLRHVLHTLSRVMAPSTPFFAEHLFQAVKEEGDEESVHLAEWPEAKAKGFLARLFGEKDVILDEMAKAREIVSEALEARDAAKLKVRQPLASLTVPASSKLAQEYLDIIADEVNVKRVLFGENLSLDTNVTPELREEGIVRDTIRLVQDARKAARMKAGEHGSVSIEVLQENRSIVEQHLAAIETQTNTKISLQ
ncbi:isoleucine--tRNA ligase [Candidatus Kaiserbacteria bacterium]|nr:isoleucine--tRNA ligase [Candidatus Kaiserbacteria bacterium]